MKLPFRSIRQIKNLQGKRVLLRSDLNVPINVGRLEDNMRLRRSLETIKYLKRAGAKVIILSHFDTEAPGSLKDVARHIGRLTRIDFVPDLTGRLAKQAVLNLKNGSAVILDNTRKNPNEKKNNLAFARKLSKYADIYVNDAFSVSHRQHASIVRLPRLLPGYAGFLFEREYKELSRIRNPEKPFFLIIGGAKFETKLPLIKKYLPLARKIFVGGGLANRLLKDLGYQVGRSVIGRPVPGSKKIAKNKKIMFPIDVVVTPGKSKLVNDIKPNEKIVDIGKATLYAIRKEAKEAKTILFNGPVGMYSEGFSEGTEGVLKILAESKSKTFVGGGDTLVLVSKFGLEKKFSFVSTSGGAMLEFLAKGTLPGIEALKK